MLRGTIDPKEPPVYEYVKFIGNFKSLNNGESHRNVPEVRLSRVSPDLISRRVCVCACRQCLTVPGTVSKE